MTNTRFYLELVGSVIADPVCILLYCTLFMRCYRKRKTRPSITREISYVSVSELLKLMFKEISLVFLFKVNRDFSISSVIILILVGKYIKINGNIKEYI
jgi:hypothetical protein